MKRQIASKHDSRSLVADIEKGAGLSLDVSRSAQVEIVEPDPESRFVIVDGKYVFVSASDGFIPFVGSAAVVALLPSVRVDDGAIKFILKGADVMRPGIVKYDEWGESGKLLVIRDDAKGRALAVGRALLDSQEMAKAQKGVCVKNLHHAGDRFWNAYKKI